MNLRIVKSPVVTKNQASNDIALYNKESDLELRFRLVNKVTFTAREIDGLSNEELRRVACISDVYSNDGPNFRSPAPKRKRIEMLSFFCQEKKIAA